MALKGARSDPVQGIKGSKPRLRRPKVLRRPETAESAKLGEEYLFRTQQQVHEKIFRQTAPTDAWGGILVGVRKPAALSEEIFSAACRCRLPCNRHTRFQTIESCGRENA